MSDAIGSKNTCKTFSTEFSTGRSRLFRLDPPVGFLSRKILVEKAFFRLRKKAQFGLQSKKAVFD